MTRILNVLSLAAIALVGFTATALAQGAVAPDDGSILDLVRPVWEAATGGHWWLAASLALVLAVALFKRYAPGRAGELAKSDAGGALLVLIGSFGGALAASLAGATAMTWGLAYGALKVAVGAAGGYALIKKLVVDPLLASSWYQEHAPAWLKSIASIATWAFSGGDGAAAIVKAEQAGDAAVAANPPSGAEGVVGKATEI